MCSFSSRINTSNYGRRWIRYSHLKKKMSLETLATGSPKWLRVARSGSTFTAAYSTDGGTWTALGSASVSIINVGRDITCSISVDDTLVQQRTGSGLTVCSPI